MSSKILLPFSFFFLVIISSLGAQDKIHPRVASQMASSDSVSCFLYLTEQLDVSTPKELTKNAKANLVFNQLYDFAQKEQENLLKELNDSDVKHIPFYIVNTIWIKATPATIQSLANRDDIQSILPNHEVGITNSLEEIEEVYSAEDSIPYGLALMGADKVWELGYRGQGVVVGGMDTGYDWTHVALKDKYRGFNEEVDHTYSWHDAIHEISPLNYNPEDTTRFNRCGYDTTSPCDDQAHGTFTMGIMVGQIDSVTFGIAPESKWIASRCMERGWGSPQTYLESLQWFLAPSDFNGKNHRPDLAPHVINNSWACPESEGCLADNYFMIERAINHLKASGIVVVVSAGNSGRKGCGTISDPPAIFENAFSVGAVNKKDSITAFSSRGYYINGQDTVVKPNVVAPGGGIISVRPNNKYGRGSGTSYSGPYVAGLVAVMISANPELAGQVDLIESIIEETSVRKYSDQCMPEGTFPDPVYGHGRVDALAAVQKALVTTSKPKPILQETSGVFKVYPTHYTDKIVVETRDKNTSPIKQLTLLDINGRIVADKIITQPTHLNSWSLPNTKSGLYLLKITTTDRSYIEKVICTK